DSSLVIEQEGATDIRLRRAPFPPTEVSPLSDYVG
ncbi:MAG: hypothetical protein ACI841_004343, partial [Planctomycetota bacterium]